MIVFLLARPGGGGSYHAAPHVEPHFSSPHETPAYHAPTFHEEETPHPGFTPHPWWSRTLPSDSALDAGDAGEIAQPPTETDSSSDGYTELGIVIFVIVGALFILAFIFSRSDR